MSADTPIWPLSGSFTPADALSGATQLDNFRHLMAREVLLGLLEKDQRVCALFASWEAVCGLHAFARREASAGLHAGNSVRFQKHVDALRPMVGDATTFVEETLQLPWFWLSWYLVQTYVFQAIRLLYGSNITFSLSLTEPDGSVPAMYVPELHIPEGTSVSEALTQISQYKHELAKAEDEIRQKQAQGLPPGRRNKSDDKMYCIVARNTYWFYQNHLCGKSIRELANNAWPDKKDRKTVRDGITESRRLLSLAS